MTKSRRRKLAEDTFQNGLGIRGMENRIRQLVDDAIFEVCRNPMALPGRPGGGIGTA